MTLTKLIIIEKMRRTLYIIQLLQNVNILKNNKKKNYGKNSFTL